MHALTKCQFPITTANDEANLCSTRTQAMLAMSAINWKQSIGTEIKRTKPLPGLCTITKDRARNKFPIWTRLTGCSVALPGAPCSGLHKATGDAAMRPSGVSQIGNFSVHDPKCAWPVFWLAVILFCPCLPMLCTVAFEQIRQAYSSGGCAGLARNAISCVTGFPFHPPADKQEGTIRISGRFYSDCFYSSIQDGRVPRRWHEAAPWSTTEGLVKRLHSPPPFFAGRGNNVIAATSHCKPNPISPRYPHELVYRQGVIFQFCYPI